MTTAAAAPPTKCPRCTGPMLAESDAHGRYGTCLSCGHVHESRVISVAELEEEQAVEEGRQRRRQPSHGKLRL
jgi:DNA-directed RNA polymerase subunit M/transcription elongation factor TFIIS